jgi:hypothetical protein
MADTRRSQSTLATSLADNTSGAITAQNVRDLLLSTHPEKTVQSGVFASEPASGQLTGDLYLPSDSFYAERWSGSAWRPWGPIFPMTKPVDGDFAWANQGGASVTTSNGGIFLNGPAGSSLDLRIRYKTAPATPWTLTVAFETTCNLNDYNYQSAGILFRQSSDGKLVTYGLQNQSTLCSMFVIKWSSPTSINTNYDGQQALRNGLPKFWRIADNGTNRICSYSADGQNFIPFHTIGRTDFLTADQIGFFVEERSNVVPATMTLLSWQEA